MLLLEQLTGRFEDDVVPFLKMVRYPFTISKSSLAAVGAPQTWPKVSFVQEAGHFEVGDTLRCSARMLLRRRHRCCFCCLSVVVRLPSALCDCHVVSRQYELGGFCAFAAVAVHAAGMCLYVFLYVRTVI